MQDIDKNIRKCIKSNDGHYITNTHIEDKELYKPQFKYILVYVSCFVKSAICIGVEANI